MVTSLDLGKTGHENRVMLKMCCNQMKGLSKLDSSLETSTYARLHINEKQCHIKSSRSDCKSGARINPGTSRNDLIK